MHIFQGLLHGRLDEIEPGLEFFGLGRRMGADLCNGLKHSLAGQLAVILEGHQFRQPLFHQRFLVGQKQIQAVAARFPPLPAVHKIKARPLDVLHAHDPDPAAGRNSGQNIMNDPLAIGMDIVHSDDPGQKPAPEPFSQQGLRTFSGFPHLPLQLTVLLKSGQPRHMVVHNFQNRPFRNTTLFQARLQPVRLLPVLQSFLHRFTAQHRQKHGLKPGPNLLLNHGNPQSLSEVCQGLFRRSSLIAFRVQGYGAEPFIQGFPHIPLQSFEIGPDKHMSVRTQIPNQNGGEHARPGNPVRPVVDQGDKQGLSVHLLIDKPHALPVAQGRKPLIGGHAVHKLDISGPHLRPGKPLEDPDVRDHPVGHLLEHHLFGHAHALGQNRDQGNIGGVLLVRKPGQHFRGEQTDTQPVHRGHGGVHVPGPLLQNGPHLFLTGDQSGPGRNDFGHNIGDVVPGRSLNVLMVGICIGDG